MLFQDTLDAVENLIKKHEAFEKSATTQEERFIALEKLTSVSFSEIMKFIKNHNHCDKIRVRNLA